MGKMVRMRDVKLDVRVMPEDMSGKWEEDTMEGAAV